MRKKKYKKQLRIIILVVVVGMGFLGRNFYDEKNIYNLLDYIQQETGVNATDILEKGSTQFTPATIVKVVDGDTITVLINNKKEKIRMIGIDTPESVHPNKTKDTKQGTIASDFTKEKLSIGKVVYLEYDKGRTDQYGRTLAYVWLREEVDKTNYEDFCKYNYGAILLQQTYCIAKYYPPNGKYKEWYVQLEKQYQ